MGYQNYVLQEENRSLKDKLKKVYDFMKQLVIGGLICWRSLWTGLARRLERWKRKVRWSLGSTAFIDLGYVLYEVASRLKRKC